MWYDKRNMCEQISFFLLRAVRARCASRGKFVQSIFKQNSLDPVVRIGSLIPTFNSIAVLAVIFLAMLASPSFAKKPNSTQQYSAHPFKVVFFDHEVDEIGRGFQVASLNSSTVMPVMVESQDSYSMTAMGESVVVKPLLNFEIKLDDESLSLALRRWAAESSFQLVWDAGKDFTARATVYEEPNIISAVEQVMKDTQNSSYPLHACAYANRIIRVLHISQTCQRSSK